MRTKPGRGHSEQLVYLSSTSPDTSGERSIALTVSESIRLNCVGEISAWLSWSTSTCSRTQRTERPPNSTYKQHMACFYVHNFLFLNRQLQPSNKHSRGSESHLSTREKEGQNFQTRHFKIASPFSSSCTHSLNTWASCTQPLRSQCWAGLFS